MISQVTGRLATRDVERVEITTAGGVTYELSIPLGTFEALPPRGDPVTLFTHLVVRDDEWLLYGFGSAHERAAFRGLLAATGAGDGAPGVVPSAPGADHAVRALVALGVAPADADKAVREAMADGGGSRDLASLIRDAL